MSDIAKRLKASLNYDVINGTPEERYVLRIQIVEAIKELERLSERESILLKLEGAGVDNWEGYDQAMEG